MLAAVVEEVSKEQYERFVERELLRPAKMTETGFWGEVDDLDRQHQAQKLEPVPASLRRANWSRRGGGGIWSTVPDLYKWLRALRDGRVLERAGLYLLMATHVDLSSTGVGYGWFTSRNPDWGTEIWTRGGESFGHNAVVRWWPESDVVVIVASNAGHALGEEANRVVSTALAQIVFEDPYVRDLLRRRMDGTDPQ